MEVKITATHAPAKQQIKDAVEELPELKDLLMDVAGGDPRRHPAVESIKFSHGGAWRIKLKNYRVAFRLYRIENEIVIEIFTGDSVSPDSTVYMDIWAVLQRTDSTYSLFKKIYNSLADVV